MQKNSTPELEKANPELKVKWVDYGRGVLPPETVTQGHC